MKRFIIGSCNEELTSNSGLALVGSAINKRTSLCKLVDKNVPQHHGISHSDILLSYLGVLSLGKNDFEALNLHREEEFFRYAMQIKSLPSVERLRQRFDEQARIYRGFIEQAGIEFLVNSQVKLESLYTGHIPLDIDVSCMDNSNSHKEGVSYTYKGFAGYAPIMGYLGKEGYCLTIELREGKRHCQMGTNATLKRAINRACRITPKKLLVRLDAGHDDTSNFLEIMRQSKNQGRKIDFVIKWNPRNKLDKTYWRNYAEKRDYFIEKRQGYREAIFAVEEYRAHKQTGVGGKYKRVMRIKESHIDEHGQALLLPEITVEGWWTTLSLSNKEIISLYNERGTSEQYHSELKTDLNLERLPSGKFATNQLVLSCALLVYNILRWLGQEGLVGKGSPIKHRAKRRRLRTVIQHLMYFAARLIKTGRRLKIAFGKHAPFKNVFENLYYKLVFQ